MTQRDPFEDYRKRREIELMEHDFQEKAGEKRQRLEDLLSESGEIEELEARVTDEMQDFLSDSTRAAEQMLERLYEQEGETGQSNEELKAELKNFLHGAQNGDGVPSAPVPQPAAPQPAAPQPAAPPQPAPPAPAPAAQPSPAALDLRAALDKIRRHGGDPTDAPEAASAPPPAVGGAKSRDEILNSFDATYQQVSDLLSRPLNDSGKKPESLPGLADMVRRDAPQAAAPRAAPPPPPPAPVSEAPAAAPTPPAFLEPSPFQAREEPATATPDPFAGAPDPFAGAPDPFGGSPDAGGMASTNAFAAEPHEDRDIDDPVPGAEPEGWNVPERKPPPGAWVVAKQKEEGDAGMAGMAGDTYLLKKLSQEVRRLNRLYLVLLEKKVVTRAEVEGPGAGEGNIAIDKAPARKAPSADDDDDEVSVNDYDEEKYRPIMTNEADFSISTLVKDVHRLKTLKIVLVKKGVVSEKELAKVKG